MALKRFSEPAVEPVSVDEVKDHLYVEHNEKNDLLALYIAAARGHVESSCHIAVAAAQYLLTLDSFPAESIYLGVTPVLSVDSIVYDDEDGAEQTIDPDLYVLDNSGLYGWVTPVAGSPWPATISAINAVRVTFTAGYEINPGSSPPVNDCPVPLRQAIMLLVGDWFENKGSASAPQQFELPYGVEALISPFRQPVLK